MFDSRPHLRMAMMSVHDEVERRRARSGGPPRWSEALQAARGPRLGSRLIGQLGSMLVALGERLERYELAETSL